MAREYARYLTSARLDPDWTSLTTTQRTCFMDVASSDDITWAGVTPYAPMSYVLASDLTERKVVKAWDELAERRLIVIDKTTGEVCVRTFLRHDNVLAKPNLTKAFIAAYRRIRSDVIKGSIQAELRRLFREQPDASGWKQIEQQMPELFRELFAEGMA